MEFVHTPYQAGETIAAIATPPGEGGIAIIRISGNSAFDIADKVFSGPIHSYTSHTAHYGRVLDQSRSTVDHALALIMKGKRSFTGEDTVEFHCHGGPIISKNVLELCLLAGARAALPGEFSFKAFMNGKLDLSQAEAISELISAKNTYALQAAEKHLEGQLSQKIHSFQKTLTHITAILEAWVDFPEEDIEFSPLEQVCSDLENLQQGMEELIQSFHNGKILHDGLSLCLVGSPNVGKSSLMNALLDEERAIVTPIPGTTRDLLEGHLHLNGLNIRLVDTAGIRQVEELIEAEGIRRSQKAMQEADLVLLVLDGHRGLNDNDQTLIDLVPKDRTVAIWNKEDLFSRPLPELPLKHAEVSAKNKTGLKELYSLIDQIIWKNGPPSKEEIVITNLRHKEALQQALQSCKSLTTGLKQGVSPEFLTIDARQSLSELGKIIGTNITEDILTSIFSSFCIGK